MNTKTQQGEAGFTLIELLMAMAVFSFMLMIVTGGFLQVVRIHQAGVASRTTQQNARLVLDGLMKGVRAAATATAMDHGAKDLLCLARGSQTLEYAVDSSGNLRVGTLSGATCPDPAVITGSWSTVNDPTVLVSQFDVTTTPPLAPGLGTAMITLTLVSRNNLAALDATQTHCVPGSGSQFCAVTTLSSGAALRGGDGL
ncbi:MAG TPA: prepilin-type N-terminal cleavage/methylation domain-containing protein [Candidatus Saccharimonadia bacterium]|nr:prepilin-type N-terminal cleavage/methylation domain-containing protein [Candidatus Saccharimonadia bacterium]